VDSSDIFALGLGLAPPWKLVEQQLKIDVSPHQLHLRVEAVRGSLFPCPECGAECKAHDFKDLTWRHLNFFQHHCYITAPVPRTNCPKHGIKRATVPWAREGSNFTLLFEQVALSLLKEMAVSTVAGHIGVTDKVLWRIIDYYVTKSIGDMNLSHLKAIAIDETASSRKQKYVSIITDIQRQKHPVIFAYPGKDSEVLKVFSTFLEEHEGKPKEILEVVSDMSKPFKAGICKYFSNAQRTVDWFHVVQNFTRAINEVRRREAVSRPMPKDARWAISKGKENNLTDTQIEALAELEREGYSTSVAWQIKEKLRWVRKAASRHAAKWRLTWFINYSEEHMKSDKLLAPVQKVVDMVKRHYTQILNRWVSDYSNARLEALNGIFQLARKRARGFRNTDYFIQMIYLIGAPIQELFST